MHDGPACRLSLPSLCLARLGHVPQVLRLQDVVDRAYLAFDAYASLVGGANSRNCTMDEGRSTVLHVLNY